MELTKEQLIETEKYLQVSGIKYYDVRKELTDHFASILEEKFKENPKLNFHQEIQNIHKNFSETGFQNLLKEKTTSITKRFYKQSFIELSSFFTIPKIIISIIFFVGLWQLMNFTDNKKTFFYILSGILIFLGFRLLFLVNIRNSKKDNFLSLDITMSFFNSFYLAVMIFNISVRENGPYLNLFYLNTLLVVFFLLILFYWCGEYVYFQNKKRVKQQYPNANIS